MSILDWENDRTTPTVSLWARVQAWLGYCPYLEPKTVGEQIAARRHALGIDQRSAAKIIGVDYTTLMRYERDEKPRGDRLLRIAQFCQHNELLR
jgi:DNA-binding XRE family transcriptional regulator